GSISESMTVTADAYKVNTTDATVSTVVDRNFAENLPMNGRSFQALINLTPGVVLVAGNSGDSGQFTVDGQRAASNYWTVDGVSANVGASTFFGGNGAGGASASFSAQGGTNSLVSVDALQEFRIQTSTYAPEFGRTPGGQVSIVTRSGTNQLHGTAFDYIRNGRLDANNWFADANGLSKPEERQNDFGGTLSGPIVRDRTFFFFSYEGLRLQLPETSLTTVPDLSARTNALPVLQPYLNAFPLPNGGDDLVTGIAQFNASYSNPATLDAFSLRLDHRANDKLTLFGRYNYSPSETVQRGAGGVYSLSTLASSRVTVQTATVGGTWTVSPVLVNEARFNFSTTKASSSYGLDGFGDAVPLASPPFPSGVNAGNGLFTLGILTLTNGQYPVGQISLGKSIDNSQRQFNVVDTFSAQVGPHTLKFGADFRRLWPTFAPDSYFQAAYFNDVPSAEEGNLSFTILSAGRASTLLFRNLGLFAQDTWRVLPRLTLTYGVRWDVDFVPQSLNGSALAAVTGFDLNNLSSLALAPPGTPPYGTTYGNLAPRFGFAYQVSRSQNWQTVLHAGFGIFYDLATSEAGNAIGAYYPFGAQIFGTGGAFPLSAAAATPPPITPASLAEGGVLYSFDPRLQLPYTLEWNTAIEQSLGKEQTLSVSYIGSAGRRLLQSAFVSAPNPNFSNVQLVTNASISDYDALQLQFERRLSRGLQVLASYSWSHSIDTASAGSVGVFSNALASLAFGSNRGPSDFDIRNAFSAALTYQIPAVKTNALAKAILGGWSTQNSLLARSALPVNVFDANLIQFNNGFNVAVRPDIVPGLPLYLHGEQCDSVFQSLGQLGPGAVCPGGKGFNPAAFVDPPIDPGTRNPTRQGDLGRNSLRGFGAFQWDFAVHRDFPVYESIHLQFRAEMFNLLNHPNFAPPNAELGVGAFGLSSQTLGQYLGGNVGGGGFSALYQVGGPRSIQLALKLVF
ncbi:MAG TPA: TonB-dependent receptor, partial [Candidatus Sulfotelmatobacter sp.]|nr:TonB-dependent receptor [Candidatus Sulfotelmatobacter sp.]